MNNIFYMRFLRKLIYISVTICFLCGQTPVLAFIPNDTFYDQQWYLEKIHASEAWDMTLGHRNVIVAVIDTGIDITHPDINFWHNSNEIPADSVDNDHNGYVDDVSGWNFADQNNNVMPDITTVHKGSEDIIHHATSVAGIIGAIPNNNEGIAGVSWKAEIMPLKIANAGGSTTTAIIVDAIRYAVDNGAEVINISLVSVDSSYDEAFRGAIDYAYKNNVLVVAAAGNGDEDLAPHGFDLNKHPVYPACFVDNNLNRLSLGVGATDRNDEKAVFSNYGNTCVDVSAPGVEMISTLFTEKNNSNLTNQYGGYWAGTSFATPLVSGAAAYMRSINPDISVQEMMQILRNSGDNLIIQDESLSGQLGVRLNLADVVRAVNTNSIPEEKKVKDTLEEEQVAQPNQIVVYGGKRPLTYYTAPYQSGIPEVSILNNDFTLKKRFLAYNTWETDGIEVHPFIDNTSIPNIVTAPGPGASPYIRLFTEGGILTQEFLAYSNSFKGGVHLAVGNVDSDDDYEMITVPRSHGGPHVRIFDKTGNLKGQFFAYDSSYRGGLQVTTGDVTGDGIDEIIIGLGSNAEPRVKIFTMKGELLSEFMAYAPTFNGGVSVIAADVTGDGITDIITGARRGGGPHIRIFDMHGNVLSQFFAYDLTFRGGVLLGRYDENQDGVADILVTPQGNEVQTKVFNWQGTLVNDFFPYGKDDVKSYSMSWRYTN